MIRSESRMTWVQGYQLKRTYRRSLWLMPVLAVVKCAGHARMTGGTKESDWDKCSRVTELRFRHVAHRKAVQMNGSGDNLISQLAIGNTFTDHDVPMFGDFTVYLPSVVN